MAAASGRGSMKSDLLDAAWQAFVFVLVVGAAIGRIRTGETWAPAFLIFTAAISWGNFSDASAKIRASREDRADASA